MARKARAEHSRKKKNRAEKRSRHLNRNVGSVSSPPNAVNVPVSYSLAQLDLSDGPISRLPNELVQSILAQLEMQELIHLLVVSKKWQAVIYSIGRTKKSLCVTYFCAINSVLCHRTVKSLKIRSFGQIDLSTFTIIKCKLNSSEHSQSQLANLFPNIESLAMIMNMKDIHIILPQMPLNQLTTLSISKIDIYKSKVVEDGLSSSTDDRHEQLIMLINSCISLKRLHIRRILFYCSMSILAPTLARLEQFIFWTNEYTLVPHFGPYCSRVSYGGDITNQWQTINNQWLASLTHLDLKRAFNPSLLIEYLSQDAVSLQVLRLNTYGIGMTPKIIGHLAKLKQLTEIDLNQIILDLSQLGEARRDFQLAQLVSMRTCTLSITRLVNSTEAESNETKSFLFASVLSAILPNVQHLNIDIKNAFYDILRGIEQYLDRFSDLQTHSFSCKPENLYLY